MSLIYLIVLWYVVKPIDEEHIKLDIYKPKITEEEEVKLKNDLKVKKLRQYIVFFSFEEYFPYGPSILC